MKKWLLLIALLLTPKALEAASITWTCDRCTPSSGSVTGASLATWSITNLTYAIGNNIVTVVATDDLGNTAADTITVIFNPSFPGNTLAFAAGMEAGSGTSAIDSSGNSNNATLVNGPTWVTGRYGSGIHLDGLNDSIDAPDTNSLDMTQSFTFSIWVKPDAVMTDFRAAMVKNYQQYLYVTADSSFCPGNAGVPLVGFFPAGVVNSIDLCGTAPLPPGQFSHLAGTYDGATLSLYVNGILVASKAATGLMDISTGALQIGESQFGENLGGTVDEARFYNWAIPLSAGGNTVPGAACVTSGGIPTNVATPSIIGDMNCQIVPPITSTVMRVSAGSEPFRFSATTAPMRFGSQ